MPADNYFLDTNTFKNIDTFRLIYLLVFLMSFAITELGRYVYRPFIYGHHIHDFGIADSIGNLGGIIVQVFLGLTFFNSPKKKGIRLIIFFGLGYILYEIVQPYLPKGVFDWNDIYGTIIGSIFAVIIFLLIHGFVKDNKIFYRFGKS